MLEVLEEDLLLVELIAKVWIVLKSFYLERDQGGQKLPYYGLKK